MSDHHAGYIVTLDSNLGEDYSRDVINAIEMIKGVVSVTPITANYELRLAEERVNDQWRSKLADFVQKMTKRP